MSQIHKHSIPANIAERCLINPEQYEAQYQQSVTDPDAFWGEQGKILDWIKPYTRVKNTSFAPGNMLACARIGAIHSVIFGGFSPEAVAGRIIDSNSRLVITSDGPARRSRDPAEEERRRRAEKPAREEHRKRGGV